jgi:predicted nucleotidyltransferase
MDADIKKKLDDITGKIISSCSPIKIILFGSAVKDKMSKDSDFDILVVMNNRTHRRKTAQLIYKTIAEVGFASDIIVVTEEDIKRYSNIEESIIYPALKEGRILYAV